MLQADLLVSMRAAVVCVAALALITPLTLAERDKSFQDTVGACLLLTHAAIASSQKLISEHATCDVPVLKPTPWCWLQPALWFAMLQCISVYCSE